MIFTASLDWADTLAAPVPALTVAESRYAEVVPVSVPTAIAPATLMFWPLPVEALLLVSVFSPWLVPLFAEAPPGVDLAVVVMVRSELALTSTELPPTVAFWTEALESPKTTEIATDAPPEVPSVPSAVLVECSLLLAFRVAAFVALSCALSETPRLASLSNAVTTTAAPKLLALLLLELAAEVVALVVTSEVARFLVLNTPGTHDSYFRDGGEPATHSDFATAPAPDYERMEAANLKHGIQMLGPPPFTDLEFAG